MQVSDPRAFRLPLISDLGRAQGKRHKLVSGLVRGLAPRGHLVTGHVKGREQRREPVLRMVLAIAAGTKRLPDRRGKIDVESWKHKRTLRESRHGAHQHARGRARTRRTGDDHGSVGRIGCPGGRDLLDPKPAPRLEVETVFRSLLDIGADYVEEFQASLPMQGIVADLDRSNLFERDSLTLHLVEKRGQAFREADRRRRVSEVRLGFDKTCGQLCQFKLTSQPGHGGRQVDSREDLLDLGHEQDPGQESRTGSSKKGGKPSLHAPGIDQETNPGKIFRRSSGIGIQDPFNHHLRKVGSGRDSEHARALSWFKHGRQGPQQRAALPGGQGRTSSRHRPGRGDRPTPTADPNKHSGKTLFQRPHQAGRS